MQKDNIARYSVRSSARPDFIESERSYDISNLQSVEGENGIKVQAEAAVQRHQRRFHQCQVSCSVRQLGGTSRAHQDRQRHTNRWVLKHPLEEQWRLHSGS